jgi:hypothetical protein
MTRLMTHRTGSPRIVAPPGHFLRDAVTVALGEVTTHPAPDPATTHLLDLALRDALASSAATGELCRVRSAATAAREARLALHVGELGRARDALRTALASLP